MDEFDLDPGDGGDFDVGDGGDLDSGDSFVVEEDGDLLAGGEMVADGDLTATDGAAIDPIDPAELSPMDSTRWDPAVVADDPNPPRPVDASNDDDGQASIRTRPTI